MTPGLDVQIQLVLALRDPSNALSGLEVQMPPTVLVGELGRLGAPGGDHEPVDKRLTELPQNFLVSRAELSSDASLAASKDPLVDPDVSTSAIRSSRLAGDDTDKSTAMPNAASCSRTWRTVSGVRRE
jgi:hypothetical protein